MKSNVLFIFRVLFGLIFIFSGFVKAIDPLGLTYKIEDYLVALSPFLNNHFSFLSFELSVFLSALEFLIGVNMLLGLHLKTTTWLSIFFMSVMTPLTLWIAIFDPVQDCGCFGDALIIGNWTTFWKNILLDIFLVSIFLLLKKDKPYFGLKSQWFLSSYSFLFSIFLSIYCYHNLPLIDFRPYKIGANIIEGMSIPKGAAPDVWDTKFIYKKNGVEKEFTLNNYPANDDSWEFVDQKSTLIKKGYEPPIHDFSIELMGEDLTTFVLNDTNYTFLLVSYDLNLANKSKSNQINDIYEYAVENGYSFYALTASVDENIQKYKNETQAAYPIALTDKITLKTIVRSNPGLVLIKQGTIINKWHINNLPEFYQLLTDSNQGEISMPNNIQHLLFVFILFAIPVIITILLDKPLINNINNYPIEQ